MLPAMHNIHSSSVSYSSHQSRFESQSYSKVDQQPISTRGAQETESSKDAASKADNFDVDALVNQIWSFASARIAKAEADGASPDEVDNMRNAAKKGVIAGFGEAKDILEGLGELSDPLKLKIDSAFGQIIDKLDDRSIDLKKETSQMPVAVKSKPLSTNRGIQLYQYERETFALNLTTAQGDKIQIRAINEQESQADDLMFGRQSSTYWGTSSHQGYSLIIKGDLNAQETEDLDALLADVNALASEFYEGDYETAFMMAKELNIDGTSLRTMELNLQEVQQKGASVYSEMAGQTSTLPRGLEPLKAYAEKLMAAQEKWASKINSADDFLKTMSHHPLNHGPMAEAAKLMMMS